MFETLKDWLASISLAPDPHDTLIKRKAEISVILYRIISADKKETDKELALFTKLFKTRFQEANDDQIHKYWDQARRLHGTLGVQVSVIKNELEKDGKDPLEFLKIINDMIIVDGIDEREYRVFSEITEKFGYDSKSILNNF